MYFLSLPFINVLNKPLTSVHSHSNLMYSNSFLYTCTLFNATRRFNFRGIYPPLGSDYLQQYQSYNTNRLSYNSISLATPATLNIQAPIYEIWNLLFGGVVIRSFLYSTRTTCKLVPPTDCFSSCLCISRNLNYSKDNLNRGVLYSQDLFHY